MASELEQLREALDGMRAGVVKKLSGLSDSDARRSTVPTGTNLAGHADIIREQIDGPIGR